MPREIPYFLIQNEKRHKKKNTCYGVFLTETPDDSKVFFGDNSWPRAEQYMKGRPHTHKGFTSQLDANRWLLEQKALTNTGQNLQHASPKEDAKTLYPMRVAKSRNMGHTIYNTDCSYTKGVSCALGIWSAPQFYQHFVPQDPKLVNHQRGELMAIRAALQHYEETHIKVPSASSGVVVFTDSEYSERSINEFCRRYKRHRGANIWFNSKNAPVKNQDVIEEILHLRSAICQRHRFFEVFFVPRELNCFADAVSREKVIEKTTDEEGKIKFKILD
jgi:ribonuclease HI